MRIQGPLWTPEIASSSKRLNHVYTFSEISKIDLVSETSNVVINRETNTRLFS